MMKIHKTVILGSIIALCILFSVLGYSFLTSNGISAATIKSRALQAGQDITSYHFTMALTERPTSQLPTGATTFSMTMLGTGAVDVTDQRLEMQSTSTIAMTNTTTYNVEYYLINNIAYLHMLTGGNSTWVRMNSSASAQQWHALNHVHNQLALLQNSTVARLPDETINGVPCHVLQVTPDVNALLQYFLSQQSGTSATQTTITPEMLQMYKNMISTITVKYWTAISSNLVQKVSENMTMNLMGISMQLLMTLTFSDYNSPVTITLPDGASQAIAYEDYVHSMHGTTP